LFEKLAAVAQNILIELKDRDPMKDLPEFLACPKTQISKIIAF